MSSPGGPPRPTATCWRAYRAGLAEQGRAVPARRATAAGLRGRAGVPRAHLRRPLPAPLALRADGRPALRGTRSRGSRAVPGRPGGQAGLAARPGRLPGHSSTRGRAPTGSDGCSSWAWAVPATPPRSPPGACAAPARRGRRVRLRRRPTRRRRTRWSSRSRPPAPAGRPWTPLARYPGLSSALTNAPGFAARRRAADGRRPMHAGVEPAGWPAGPSSTPCSCCSRSWSLPDRRASRRADRRGRRSATAGPARPPRGRGCRRRPTCSTVRTASTRWRPAERLSLGPAGGADVPRGPAAPGRRLRDRRLVACGRLPHQDPALPGPAVPRLPLRRPGAGVAAAARLHDRVGRRRGAGRGPGDPVPPRRRSGYAC